MKILRSFSFLDWQDDYLLFHLGKQTKKNK